MRSAKPSTAEDSAPRQPKIVLIDSHTVCCAAPAYGAVRFFLPCGRGESVRATTLVTGNEKGDFAGGSHRFGSGGIFLLLSPCG